MGNIVFKLVMASAPFVELPSAKIYFRENGTVKALPLEEWRAYFPGCSDPFVMVQGSSGQETIWMGSITDRFRPMMNAIGWPIAVGRVSAAEALPGLCEVIEHAVTETPVLQERYRIAPEADDTEPPTIWTLLQFLAELRTKCIAHPGAALDVSITGEMSLEDVRRQHGRTALEETLARSAHDRVAPGTLSDRVTALRELFDRGDIGGEQYQMMMSEIREDFARRVQQARPPRPSDWETWATDWRPGRASRQRGGT